MDDNNSRSSLERAIDLAQAAKAVSNIARGATAGGVYGAAAATVKEAAPFLVKAVAAVLVVLFLIPMLVFVAMPNPFFGYLSSETEPVARMTGQALAVGSTYMSLEDFEKTYIDALVTSIAAEYEQNGTQIDRIEVHSSFTEDDLLWFIAINSVAHRQDLESMSVEDIRTFSVSRLSVTPSLLSGEGVTLWVEIRHLDPDVLMDKLGFEDDARTWAGALYETLSESGALEQYAGYFGAHQPDYSGDNSYSGSIEYGGEHDNTIDISHFVSPGTKNNLDLAAYAVQAWEHGWGYVWGTFGSVLTESLLEYKLDQYPKGVGNYEDFIRENWLGGRTTDCVGLIKGYGWLDVSDLTIRYATNGMPDYSANQMYQSAAELGTEYGTMDTMPDVVGLAVWKEGHIGVYIGGGYVIEAMGTKYGVVKTELEGRGWQGWCKLPYIEYLSTE